MLVGTAETVAVMLSSALSFELEPPFPFAVIRNTATFFVSSEVSSAPTAVIDVVLNDKEFVNVLAVVSAAVAGATEDKTPNPNAATVTSAMRLKVVFVDICFLSISRTREFPSFGFELIS
jgi:hypothetical protein